MYLNRTWFPNMSITGGSGLPAIESAGNVLRPKTSVRLSIRLCPKFDSKEARNIVVKALTENPPYNCKVSVGGDHSGNGWCMKDLEPWFHESIMKAGKDFFGKETGSFGEGGAIPFLNELGVKYPNT